MYGLQSEEFEMAEGEMLFVRVYSAHGTAEAQNAITSHTNNVLQPRVAAVRPPPHSQKITMSHFTNMPNGSRMYKRSQ